MLWWLAKLSLGETIAESMMKIMTRMIAITTYLLFIITLPILIRPINSLVYSKFKESICALENE